MVTLDGKTGKVIEEVKPAGRIVRELPSGDYELDEVQVTAKRPTVTLSPGAFLALATFAAVLVILEDE